MVITPDDLCFLILINLALMVASVALTVALLRRPPPTEAGVGAVKYYDKSIRLLEEEQGEWYVNFVIETELAKLYKHYTRVGSAAAPVEGCECADDCECDCECHGRCECADDCADGCECECHDGCECGDDCADGCGCECHDECECECDCDEERTDGCECECHDECECDCGEERTDGCECECHDECECDCDCDEGRTDGCECACHDEREGPADEAAGQRAAEPDPARD
jgi:hypothetical protein